MLLVPATEVGLVLVPGDDAVVAPSGRCSRVLTARRSRLQLAVRRHRFARGEPRFREHERSVERPATQRRDRTLRGTLTRRAITATR